MTMLKVRPGHVATPFDHLVHGFFGKDIAQFLGSDDLHRSAPRVNIKEDANAFHLEMLAPGFTKEDIKLNLAEGVLTVSAEHEEQKSAEGTRYTRREFGRHSFKRSFHLPEHVNGEAIQAVFSNGLLTVDLPKMEPVKPASKAITIQ